MKIPVPGGAKLLLGSINNSYTAGSIDDYFCCIGRGMIQFVCKREGRGKIGTYRSMTQDKIIIHPGSVMFRADPQYIVAGEIVRTSRMYAMSVSPLTKRALERIRPGIFYEDGKPGADKQEKPKKARDFTNNIKIAGEVFEVKTVKRKKIVILPWEKLFGIRDQLPLVNSIRPSGSAKNLIGSYKGLKGTVIYKNEYRLLDGEKLSFILSLTPTLDTENALKRTWPRKQNFNSKKEITALLEHLDNLVRPAIWKKGSKELGFLALFTDSSGNYWLRCSRGFHTALNESLFSLEVLITELGDIDIGKKHLLNQCYRRLMDYLYREQ